MQINGVQKMGCAFFKNILVIFSVFNILLFEKVSGVWTIEKYGNEEWSDVKLVISLSQWVIIFRPFYHVFGELFLEDYLEEAKCIGLDQEDPSCGYFSSWLIPTVLGVVCPFYYNYHKYASTILWRKTICAIRKSFFTGCVGYVLLIDFKIELFTDNCLQSLNVRIWKGNCCNLILRTQFLQFTSNMVTWFHLYPTAFCCHINWDFIFTYSKFIFWEGYWWE